MSIIIGSRILECREIQLCEKDRKADSQTTAKREEIHSIKRRRRNNNHDLRKRQERNRNRESKERGRERRQTYQSVDIECDGRRRE